MTTIITLASQKGGVGKTTSAVNMAMAFAVGGYRVLLIDLDPQGSVRTSFGIMETAQHGVLEVFQNPRVETSQLITPTRYRHIDLILSNLPRLAQEQQVYVTAADPYYLKRWIALQVPLTYDFVILDAPAAINPLSINAMVASDLIVVPLQCEVLAVRSLKRFLVAFQDLQDQVRLDLRIAGILLTMYDSNLEIHRVVYRQVQQVLQDSIFQTVIPKCPHILEASAMGMTVIHQDIKAIGSTAYIRFANELVSRFHLK